LEVHLTHGPKGARRVKSDKGDPGHGARANLTLNVLVNGGLLQTL
jgi:hypothetical protein